MFNSFSPNMLKTYETCPKKFHFKYIKSLNMPVNDLSRGTTADEIVLCMAITILQAGK